MVGALLEVTGRRATAAAHNVPLAAGHSRLLSILDAEQFDLEHERGLGPNIRF